RPAMRSRARGWRNGASGRGATPGQLVDRYDTLRWCLPTTGAGKLKGRQPKLSAMQQRELRRMHQTGEYTISDLGELFSVSRPTVYRTISRTNP
ncbi:MAG: helix-turn-helix domain-containing protein, partial [Ilumatobacteraceae bacterium]